MRRIQSACLLQTIRFETAEEWEGYKHALNKKRIVFKIDEVNKLSDGSVQAKIRRAYNTYDCAEYLV